MTIFGRKLNLFIMNIQKKLIPLTRNFYVVTASAFVLWMVFFDTNDSITQIKNTILLQQLKSDTSYYSQKVKQVQKDKKELNSSNKLLEKFAREKYLMKKKEEEIFVIQEESNKQ
jgi:cell division protein FtsB